MAEQLTIQQAQAVNDRGGRLLVSAAAGSGKTKVLVDRLLSYLTQPDDPANIDDFLIITYTKAAAAELRGKISAKLTEHLSRDPENKHLQRQLQRLYLAKISTVHSFCGDLLREYAYRLDLPGDFRVADENECRLLRDAVMEKVLEQAYDRASADEAFRCFVDTQGLGRTDRLVPEILLKVYDSARCHLDPEGWLDRCVQSAEVAGLEDAAQTLWGKYLLEDLRAYLRLQLQAMTHCANLAEQATEMEKPASLLRNTCVQLQALARCQTWDEVVSFGDIDYGRLVFSKKITDQELAEGIKTVRTQCKKGLEKKRKAFADPSDVVLEDMRRCALAVRGMVALVRTFDASYAKAKKARRILDFGDLEHRTLELLLGKHHGQPTALAREIGARFREIMVDEYQDSNGVQDAIFTALTQEKQNCFMVGDVKQSIYQFRLADPGIFLQKYNEYPDASQAQPGEGRRVLLSHNFRSGGGVLAGVNDIFRLCMSPAVGGLHYGEAEALREGCPHVPLGQPEVELLALEVREHTYPEEAALVAQRVQQLLDGKHFVRQGDALRPIVPEDIAILLRSPGSVGPAFQAALAQRGIRCVTGGGEDLLQTQEVATLRALLQTVSNPRQDIPLIAALASPLFGFTADDLAALRGQNRKGAVYDALKAWQHPKAERFLSVLQVLRRESRMVSLTELLEKVFSLTGMERIFAAMPNGSIRWGNLQTFYALAGDFASLGRRDLNQFLDFLEGMEEKGLVSNGEQSASGAVTLMSIHKSKGLEFPVVIVAGLSREFNRESVRAQVLCDRELGLGLTAVDPRNRVRYPTLAKRAIALKTTMDSLSEELRVLYVALTRARDKLIMTYASGSLAADVQEIASRLDLCPVELLTADVVCPGQWVLMAALRRTEAGALFALGARPGQTEPGEPAWEIRVVEAPQGGNSLPQEEATARSLPAGAEERLHRGLMFQYGHESATRAPSKQTATQRKGRDKDAEAAENAPAPVRAHAWRKPGFAQYGGKDYGTAVHLAMQYIRYEACADVRGVETELQRLTQLGFLTREQAEAVPANQLAAFFGSPLGQKLRSGREVLREFKFSILDDGENYDPALSGEQILLQGVVDCALIEEDGITVVDFKTDRVTEETLPQRLAHYRPQVLAYASALERIYEKPVKASLLYFFRLEKFVPVK